MRRTSRLVGVAVAALLALPGVASGANKNQVNVQLLGINDFHGALEQASGSGGRIVEGGVTFQAGGAAKIATAVDQLEKTNPNTLVLSAGDLIGASPLLSALFHDEPTIEAMNAIGLDYNAVGNHEFDEGSTELVRMQEGGCHPVDGCDAGHVFQGADFGFLAANVVDKVTRKPLFPAYAIEEFNGVKVGIIGMTLEGTPSIVVPSGVATLDFLDEADTANKYARILRKEHGVKTIVVLLHEGAVQNPLTSSINACNGISGAVVDIVNRTTDAVGLFITGHTHQAYNCVIDERPVTSAASNGRLITDIDLAINRRSGTIMSVAANNTIVDRATLADDSTLTTLISAYKVLAAPIEARVVGKLTEAFERAKTPSGESQAGNLIADSQHAATDNEQGAVAAFMNPGGVRADFPFNPPNGELTYKNIFDVQPFGNNLTTLTVTGAQLLTMLDQQWCGRPAGTAVNGMVLIPSSTVSYTFDESLAATALTQPCPSAVSPIVGDVKIGGQAVTAGGSYRITVNSFLADGGDAFTILTQATNRVGGVVDLDALEAYLKPTILGAAQAPPATNRITVVP